MADRCYKSRFFKFLETKVDLDTPEGDFARDSMNERNSFPMVEDSRKIIHWLACKGACKEAVDAFVNLWTELHGEEKGELAKQEEEKWPGYAPEDFDDEEDDELFDDDDDEDEEEEEDEDDRPRRDMIVFHIAEMVALNLCSDEEVAKVIRLLYKKLVCGENVDESMLEGMKPVQMLVYKLVIDRNEGKK